MKALPPNQALKWDTLNPPIGTPLIWLSLCVCSGAYGPHQASQSSSGSLQMNMWCSPSLSSSTPPHPYGSNRPAPVPAPAKKLYAPMAHPSKPRGAVYDFLSLRLVMLMSRLLTFGSCLCLCWFQINHGTAQNSSETKEGCIHGWVWKKCAQQSCWDSFKGSAASAQRAESRSWAPVQTGTFFFCSSHSHTGQQLDDYQQLWATETPSKWNYWHKSTLC